MRASSIRVERAPDEGKSSRSKDARCHMGVIPDPPEMRPMV